MGGLPLDLNATDYRLKAKLREAEAEGAPKFAAFVPRFKDRGGRGRRISEEIIRAMESHAREYLQSGKVPNQSKMYADFVNYATRSGWYVPSHETHRRVIKKALPSEQLALLSGGKRAFHAARPRVDGAFAIPRLKIAGLHVHLDGVYSDAKAKPDEKKEHPRPIFYPLLDDMSAYVFGVGVKLGRGSMLPVLMAHRDCYQRHGFLPCQIIEDWGSEFNNTVVPEMRAKLGVGYERRPAGAPRFGGRGEGFNAHFSAFLQNLSGGTYFDKKGRSSDPSKRSRATASLDVRTIVDAAFHWIFEVWNRSPVGSQDRSPEELLKESIDAFPEAVVPVKDDVFTRYVTSLPLKSQRVTYIDGFRYAGRSYTSIELVELMRSGGQVHGPRLDCMNPSIVYVQSSAGPIALRSNDYNALRDQTTDVLMQEMHRTLGARSTARGNQLLRNRREAEAIRKVEAISVSQAEPVSPSPAAVESDGRSRPNQFSDILREGIQELNRFSLEADND